MSVKLIAALNLFLCVIQLSTCSEQCTIPSTGEPGECISLRNCPSLLAAYKKDRTHVPTICNREARKICCPLKFTQTSEAPAAAPVYEPASRFDFEENVPEIIKKCNEFKIIADKREAADSFIIGEPSSVSKTPVCRQNRANVGIASEKEFPHIAIVKLQHRQMQRNAYGAQTKCVGSLISDQHVLTSIFCVQSDINHEVTVQLGGINFIENNSGNTYEVEDIDKIHGVAVLKLKTKVEFNENVMPICLFPDQNVTSEVVLAGWTGDWRECDPKLKKWHVANNFVEHGKWHLKIDESVVINYRQTLLPGSPLQIYHPDNTCQYSLVGVFEQVTQEQYVFNQIFHKLHWIETTVWP